jgi:uncharacterized protein DUF4235
MVRVLYRLAAVLVSVLGGMLASVIFKRVWKLTAGEDETPRSTDSRRGWREVLAAGALQGAIGGVVTAAVDRAAAHGAAKVTGSWPGDPSWSGDDDPRPGKDA